MASCSQEKDGCPIGNNDTRMPFLDNALQILIDATPYPKLFTGAMTLTFFIEILFFDF